MNGAPDALSAADALRLATLDAARALRLDGEVGALTPGKRADLTVVSLAGSPYHPVEDPAARSSSGLAGAGSETIVDGMTRYRQGENTWQEVRSTASAARRQMLAEPQATRSDRRKPKQAKQHAKWQDELFFSRLRVHAKWVFVLLAVVFGLGFVLLGVGSGSTGIADALQSFFQLRRLREQRLDRRSLAEEDQPAPDRTPRPGALSRRLRERSSDDRRDHRAVDLHDAEAEGRRTRSTELAGLYLGAATSGRPTTRRSRPRTEALGRRSPFQPTSTSPLGKAFASLKNPIQSAVQSTTAHVHPEAPRTRSPDLPQPAAHDLPEARQADPKDANIQFELAQAAQDAGNIDGRDRRPTPDS